MLHKATLQFVSKLDVNNNRDWFAENRHQYEESLLDAKSFFSKVNERLQQHDQIEKQKIYRIYRDVRFSKDKTPYNPRFATAFTRLGKELRGSYFLQIKPNESMLGGGFWKPEKEDLLRIRKEFEIDDNEIRDILKHKDFQKVFGGKLVGEELKTAPKGFDKNHSAIDLIRKKSYIAIRNFTDEEVLAEDFIDKIDFSFRTLRPYLDLMSNILTTNLNGESIL